MSKKGISLISLIITIIVVIILAAIAIFSGFKAVEEAELAKFVHEVSEFETAAQHDYLNRQTNLRVSGVNEKKEITYSKIAGGDDTPSAELNVADIVTDENARAKYNGDKCYLVTDTANIANWTTPKNFTGRSDETIYLTNQGEVIITPGLTIKKDNGEEVTYYNANISTDAVSEGGNTPSAPTEKQNVTLGSLFDKAEINHKVRIIAIPTPNTPKFFLSAEQTGSRQPTGPEGLRVNQLIIDGTITAINNATGEITIFSKELGDSYIPIVGEAGISNWKQIRDMVYELQAQPAIGYTKDDFLPITFDDLKEGISNWDEIMADAQSKNHPITFTAGRFLVDGEWQTATVEQPITLTPDGISSDIPIQWKSNEYKERYKHIRIEPRLYATGPDDAKYMWCGVTYQPTYDRAYFRPEAKDEIYNASEMSDYESLTGLSMYGYLKINGNKATVTNPDQVGGGVTTFWKVKDVQ